jgi:hypothetical protein
MSAFKAFQNLAINDDYDAASVGDPSPGTYVLKSSGRTRVGVR